MKQKTAPYINFQGRAREAMEFYHGIFGGKLSLYSADEKGQMREAEPGDPIMHARLDADGVMLLGSDGSSQFPVKAGDNIAIVLMGADRDALASACDRLAEGGVLKMPLRKGQWGGEAAWLSDRFGINWNIDVEAD